MPIEQMEAAMKTAMNGLWQSIEMNGLVTDHLRVECDREHPVSPSDGEMNGGPWNVQFAILNPLKAYGEIKATLNRQDDLYRTSRRRE